MCGSMGSGLMPGKSGSGLERICTLATPMRVKMSERMVPPAPYMESMAELHARFGDEVEVGEAFDGLEVGRQEVDLNNGRGLRGARDGLAEIGFDRGDHGGLARAAVPALVFHAVPLRGIVRGGDHDAAGGAALAHREAERRRGRDGVGQFDANARGRNDFGAGACKCLRAEARVVADADSLVRIFLRVNVGGDGLGGDAHVRESKVVGDDAAPSVGAEFDLWDGA